MGLSSRKVSVASKMANLWVGQAWGELRTSLWGVFWN